MLYPFVFIFQELEDVYVDLCKELSDSVMVGSEIIATGVSYRVHCTKPNTIKTCLGGYTCVFFLHNFCSTKSVKTKSKLIDQTPLSGIRVVVVVALRSPPA